MIIICLSASCKYRATVPPHDYTCVYYVEAHRLQALSSLKLIASLPIAPPGQYIITRIAMLRDDAYRLR